jgi:tetratricopeptide (TPR) repeat protein
VAARPRRLAAPDLARIVAALDQGRVAAGIPRVTETTESVPLLFAAGRRALLRSEREEARAWLTRAQSRSSRRTSEPLRARIAFELGCILLDEGGSEAAESVIAWAESFSSRPSSDVLHLRALIADRRGRRTEAIALYRQAIAKAGSALSPLSRVLELRNLAETLAHESPAEALTMYRHALETLQARDLDPRLAPALHNGLAYAAICAGDLDLATAELAAATRDAVRLRLPLMEAYASYNRSIVAELSDDIAGATAAIRQARALAETEKLRDLVAWCWIRESWLAIKRKDRREADRAASSARKISGASHVEALTSLDAIVTLIDGDHLKAAKTFGDLAQAYLERSDHVTAVALLLWRAVAYRKASAAKGAKAAARDACELRRRGPVRVSPSWWAREVVDAARADGGEQCASDLLATAVGILDAPRGTVEIRGDEILIGATPLAADAWQRRSGARVLRRLFAMLVAAHPRGLSRDDLTDELWPDSEGDKAVRNLYAATKDLRRVVAEAPGVRLVARGGGYALEVDTNVTVIAHRPSA